MPKKYIQKLDFFRALSVMLVVLYHFDVPLFKGGFIGVDIFFVISGFLITGIIKSEYDETQKFNFTRFYIKRARRLLPSLFLMLACVFVATYFVFSPGDFMKSTQSLFMTTLIVSNFYFFKESGYFDKSSELEPLLHTWSLGIEEQFYLLWPLCLILILSFFKKKPVVIISILLAVSLGITFYLYQFDGAKNLFNALDTTQLRSAIFYLLPFRIFEFLVGALCAFFYAKKDQLKIGALIPNIAGIATIILSAILFHKQLNYLGILNIIPCLGIALILLSKVPTSFNTFYNNKFIGIIGKASYTWYLFHWPIIVLSKYYLERNLNVLESGFLFISSLILSIVIFKFFENPIRYNTTTFQLKSNKVFTGIILAFITTAGMLSYNVSANDGWLFRLNESQIELATKIDNVEDYHKTFWGGAGYKAGIIENPKSKNKKVDLVMLGESHCGHFLHGIESVLVNKYNKKIYIANLMNPSAIYLPDIIPTHLPEKKVTRILNKTIKILKQNPNATLLISHYWAVQLNRSKALLADGKTVKLQNNITGFTILMNKLNKLIRLVGNRKVIIFGTGPIMPYTNKLNHIERILKPNFSANSKIPPTQFRLNNNYYRINDFLSEYVKDKPNFYFFDPREPFCPTEQCYVQKDNVIYLSDWDHLSKDGSLFLIEHFENRLLKIVNE